ncbi:unnamed protein product [Blepharisma stoltei]|uniref:Uncharacterized protein n=1 Tax=Blepharisma stoltei TaxID=1481888 RepID=A0AAU9K6S0_9CILI|nr:unnamed protein product [Blepharisma stoltei]
MNAVPSKEILLRKNENSLSPNKLIILSPKDQKPQRVKVKITTYYAHRDRLKSDKIMSLNSSPKSSQDKSTGFYKLYNSNESTPKAAEKPFKFPNLPISLSNKVIKKHKNFLFQNDDNMLARGVSLKILPIIVSPLKPRVVKNEINDRSLGNSPNKRWIYSNFSSASSIKRAAKLQSG